MWHETDFPTQVSSCWDPCRSDDMHCHLVLWFRNEKVWEAGFHICFQLLLFYQQFLPQPLLHMRSLSSNIWYIEIKLYIDLTQAATDASLHIPKIQSSFFSTDAGVFKSTQFFSFAGTTGAEWHGYYLLGLSCYSSSTSKQIHWQIHWHWGDKKCEFKISIPSSTFSWRRVIEDVPFMSLNYILKTGICSQTLFSKRRLRVPLPTMAGYKLSNYILYQEHTLG